MIHQWLRIVFAFICNPDATTGEIYSYLERSGGRIRNITGRMSDARIHGIIFAERKDAKGLHRYSIEHIPEAVASRINFTFKSPEKAPILNLTMD